MTDEEKAAKRAELQSAIAAKEAERAKYQEILDKLNEALAIVTEQQSLLHCDVMEPLSEYDITDGGSAWRGDTATEASEKKDEILSDLNAYDAEVTTLIGEIQDAIEKVTEIIDKLTEEIEALYTELQSLW